MCVFLEAGAGAQVGGLPGMCRALGSTSSTKPLNNSVMCLVVLFPFFSFCGGFIFVVVLGLFVARYGGAHLHLKIRSRQISLRWRPPWSP